MASKKQLEERILSLESKLASLSSEKRIIDIVYPNVSRFSQWEELKYSIRSLEKNLRDISFRLFIVGDWPEWLNPLEAFHIACEYSGKTPRIDIIHKHLAVIADDRVGEEYFWMNDDIYLVNPVSYADICLNVAVNNLREARGRMSRQTVWGRDNHRTYDLLKSQNLPTWNYAAHIPHRFEKKKVSFLIESFRMLETPLVLEQLYYNFWFRDMFPYFDTLEVTNNQGFCVNRQDPNIANLEAQLKVKKYMNNGEGGMGTILKKYLRKLFPEPSSFETS